MDRAWQRYLDVATGFTEVTRKRAERVVRGLVKQGEVAADQVERTVDDLLRRSERNRQVIGTLVRNETERAVDRLGLARQRDVTRLEEELERVRASPPERPQAAAETAGSKSAAAKRAARKAATSTTAATSSTAKKTSGPRKRSTPGTTSSSAASKTPSGAATRSTGAAKKTAASATAAKKTPAGDTATVKKTPPPSDPGPSQEMR